MEKALTISISVEQHRPLLLEVSPIFFIISKINDQEAKSFSLLRNKILNEIG